MNGKKGIAEEEIAMFNEFEDLNYYLFVETNIGYGVTGNYYRYGIYGNTVEYLICKKKGTSS